MEEILYTSENEHGLSKTLGLEKDFPFNYYVFVGCPILVFKGVVSPFFTVLPHQSCPSRCVDKHGQLLHPPKFNIDT